MKANSPLRLILLAALVCPVLAQGYETPTHAAMTYHAIVRSILTADPAASPAFADLGISEVASTNFPTPYGSRYIHISPGLTARGPHRIEKKVIERTVLALELPTEFLPYDSVGWLVGGAVREDDNTIETFDSDEPGGPFNRVFGHFYDPQNGRGLVSSGVGTTGPTARDWAFSPAAQVSVYRSNHYKVSDAREAMWRALTLTTIGHDGALIPAVNPTNWSDASKEELRKAYWATVLRTLGHVVHLVQDMAQPQHTRIDEHSGLLCLWTVCATGGHTSFFEKYAMARTYLEEGFQLNSQNQDVRFTPEPLKYDNYPSPRFATFEDYFASAEGGGNSTGKGLANFSNRNFYSVGTNAGSLRATEFASPHPLAIGLGDESVPGAQLRDLRDMPVSGVVHFKTGTATDHQFPEQSVPSVRLTTYGIWNQFLQQKNLSWNSYTLNIENYRAQADILVKRAVGYSSGLIDHFFRGKLKIGLPADGVYGAIDQMSFVPTDGTTGFRKIKARVQNATAPIGAAVQDMAGGKLVAVLKYRRNKVAYSANLSSSCDNPSGSLDACRGDEEKIIVSSATTDASGAPATVVSLAAGAPEVEFHFHFDEGLPLDVTDVYLQVVFRGALGSEQDAVAVGTQNISEPTYSSVFNISDSLSCANGEFFNMNPDGTFPDLQVATQLAQQGHAVPIRTTAEHAAVTFREPLPVPPTRVWETTPLAYRATLLPGQYFRIAVLADENDAFGRRTRSQGDAVPFQYKPPNDVVVQEMGILFPQNFTQFGITHNMTRGTRHHFTRRLMTEAGSACPDQIPPALISDPGPYATPTQVSVSIAF